jgi:MinD-like ATPase involved in chromosome partitioning or flagellar assembly
VDLPTYTNIWRIEKRLYKLYDFRLPAPVPITWIAVFTGITVPYVVFLIAIGLPFNHSLVWLYVLPPGVLTWLCTRPVIENKKLPELVGSQLRYLSEPRSWCRMVPSSEKEEIQISVRVWRRYPPKPKARRKAARLDRRRQLRPSTPAHTKPRVLVAAGYAEPVVEMPQAREPAAVTMTPEVLVQQRATAQPAVSQAERTPRSRPLTSDRPAPWPSASTTSAWKPRPAPLIESPSATGWAPRPAPLLRQVPSPGTGTAPPPLPPEPHQHPEFQQQAELQAAPQDLHEAPEQLDPQLELPEPPSPAVPEAAAPEPAPQTPDPEDGTSEPAHEVPDLTDSTPEPADATPATASAPAPSTASALEVAHDAEPADWHAASPDQELPSWSGPPQPTQAQQRTPRTHLPHHPPVGNPPQPPATAPRAKVVDLDAERPLPSIERAISAPNAGRDLGWRRRVKVVAGGKGPGKRDQESLDRDRSRLPLSPPPRWIVMLGCTGGAGQTTTTLLTGRLLAQLRQHPVAAITAANGNPQGATISTVLSGRRPPGKGFEVIADDGTAQAADYQRLAAVLAGRYPLTVVDPAPAEMTRVLSLADQLVIVVPGTAEAASSLANTQQWLDAHGYGNLAQRAVTLVNGVRKDMMSEVLRAESVARGRCRAIVRVPWDDLMAGPQPLAPQTRLAFTALAGVLVAGLAAAAGREPR